MLALLCSFALAGELGVGGYVGHYAPPVASPIPASAAFGGRLRYRFGAWGVETAVGTIGPRILDPRIELSRYIGDPLSPVAVFVAGGPGLILGASSGGFADLGAGIDSSVLPVLDLRTDLRYRVIVGASGQVSSGFFATIGLSVHSLRPLDKDGDGVLDRADACAGLPEDRDGFEDTDGCADPDNDGDGIADLTDRCAAEAEDDDSFEDSDGCPEADNDRDGLADPVDQCPGVAEDLDAFEDADGCPELDNDEDDVGDAADGAPNNAETLNRYQDGDGVPDTLPAELSAVLGVLATADARGSFDAKTLARLDAIAAISRTYPDARLALSAHPDAMPAAERVMARLREKGCEVTLKSGALPGLYLELN